eukprot:6225208-Amphidinium_carterae.1
MRRPNFTPQKKLWQNLAHFFFVPLVDTVNTPDCRPLKKKKVKKRPIGFAVPKARSTSPTHRPSAGSSSGGQAVSSSNEVPGRT